jgi:6-pyruvoyl-tetrahydropterin synthase
VIGVISGVSGHFCASHRCPDTGNLHGHTWSVMVKFRFREGFDAARAKRNLDAYLSEWDHSILPDELASGEQLAQAIGTSFVDCIEVQISRPMEGIYAWWLA